MSTRRKIDPLGLVVTFRSPLRSSGISANKHPSTISLDELAKHVRLEFTRRKGPGGQHRNKVETAVIATHVPTGCSAESNGERSQAANREIALFRLRIRLAIKLRSESRPTDEFVPSELWLGRLRGKRLEISEAHRDFPSLLTEALDRVHVNDGDVSRAAQELKISASQLVKLFKKEPIAFAGVNQLRKQHGLKPLK